MKEKKRVKTELNVELDELEITREDAIKAIQELMVACTPDSRYAKVGTLAISALERQTGEWIESHVPESILCECSLCHFSCGAYSYNFCPNCGAKMRKESEYHADPYHADFAWDVKTVVDNLRKESHE